MVPAEGDAMTRQNVPGRLDAAGLATLAGDPRLRHRPDDPVVIRREAVALLRLGLSLVDVAQALRMPPAELSGLLAEDLPINPEESDQ